MYIYMYIFMERERETHTHTHSALYDLSSKWSFLKNYVFSPRTQSKPAQVDLFWKEGDFGYIMERKEDMISMCEPQEKVVCSLPFLITLIKILQNY